MRLCLPEKLRDLALLQEHTICNYRKTFHWTSIEAWLLKLNIQLQRSENHNLLRHLPGEISMHCNKHHTFAPRLWWAHSWHLQSDTYSYPNFLLLPFSDVIHPKPLHIFHLFEVVEVLSVDYYTLKKYWESRQQGNQHVYFHFSRMNGNLSS